MPASPHSRFNLALLESCILKKRGLFITPILSACFAAKVLPTLLLGFLPSLLAAVIYRTVRVPGNKFKVFGASFGIAVLSLITLRVNCLEVRYVVGVGMSPNVSNGSRVLVDKTAYWWQSPKRGDIIIAKLDILRDLSRGVTHVMDRQDVKISRIFRLPGETVEVKDGNRYFTAKVGDSPKTCIPSDTKHPSETLQPFSLSHNGQDPLARGVQSECFFLFRDDNPISDRYDHWAIPQKSIIGKVVAVLWPLQESQQKPIVTEVAKDF